MSASHHLYFLSVLTLQPIEIVLLYYFVLLLHILYCLWPSWFTSLWLTPLWSLHFHYPCFLISGRHSKTWKQWNLKCDQPKAKTRNWHEYRLGFVFQKIIFEWVIEKHANEFLFSPWRLFILSARVLADSYNEDDSAPPFTCWPEPSSHSALWKQ